MLQVNELNQYYGGSHILRGVSFQALGGEVTCLLGRNGVGKTTLLKCLMGLIPAKSGDIVWQGKKITHSKPHQRVHAGVAYVPQGREIFPRLTVEENLLLGLSRFSAGDAKQVPDEIWQLFPVLKEMKHRRGGDLSGGQQQQLAIGRALASRPQLLILDEPTAVLTPQETEKLFAVLRNMRKAGKSIIIITHKLNEVLELSDRVAVLRKGKYIDTVETAKATVESLTEMMVGEKVKLDINRTEPVGAEKRIEMRGITCKNKEGLKVLTEASFTAYSGEILGVAGISGSGQKELLESVAGLQPIESGEILYFSPEGTTEKISEMKAEDIKNLGITLSFVPEDRLGMGLVGSMNLTDNMMIRSYKEGRHFFADRKSPKKLAEDIVEKLDVVTPGVDTPVSRLSGGNVQKILVGREIASNPTVLMVAYPVRGLDINSSYTIYNLLNDQKKKGVAVICVGEDLDVLLELCDKILVLNSGKVAGIVDARTTTKEKLGLMMTGLTEDKNE